MEKVVNGIKSNWRRIVTAMFILVLFTMPASKSLFVKIFNLDVQAGGGVGGKHKHDTNNQYTQSVPSVSVPDSQSTVSPMSNSQSNSQTYTCSHSRSHSRSCTHSHSRSAQWMGAGKNDRPEMI